MSDPVDPPENIHATAVVVGEAGVLIRGPSGAGKSALALALVALAREAGVFARLVGDDRVLVAPAHGVLVARPHPGIAGRVERRGEGVADIAHESAAVLRCVIDIAPGGDEDLPRMPAAEDLRVVVAAVSLPRLTLRARDAATESARRAFAFVERLPR